jgi:hypothetical protein
VAKKKSTKKPGKGPPSRRRLAVRWRRQKLPFYCGPACIQMVLGHLKVTRSQDQCFADVVSNSEGARPAETACEPERACYETQVCDLCGTTWECWDTDPEALAATLNDHTSASTRYAVHFPATLEDASWSLIDSLRTRTPPVPAITSILSVNHWVVVNGYELGDPATLEPDASGTVEHPPINGFYLLDPREVDGDERLRLVTTTEWSERLGLIECGPHQDEYVVIVAS